MTRFRIESDRQTPQVPNRASPMPTTTGRRFFWNGEPGAAGADGGADGWMCRAVCHGLSRSLYRASIPCPSVPDMSSNRNAGIWGYSTRRLRHPARDEH